MSERKLKKKEVMIVSRILEDVNFKYYIEYLLSNKVEKILKSSNNKNEKILMVLGDVVAFILQNIHKAEDNIDALIMSYKKISQEEVDDMDEDIYIDTLKIIFMAGIPKVIQNYVDLTEVKKKLKQATNDNVKN